jgi:hypothetical protein
VASGHRYELFLEKTEHATYIKGPYYNSFYRSHNITLHEVVTFTLIKKLRKRKMRKHMKMMKMRKELRKRMKSKEQKSMCST